MLRPSSGESVAERFIGWMTVALGVGALVPRPGLGLYSLLQAGGWRIQIGVVMLFCGLLLVACSYIQRFACRLSMLAVALCCWIALAFAFVTGGLWGATCQAIVVIVFSNGCAWRLWREMNR